MDTRKKFEPPQLTVEKLSEELVIANLKLKEANEKLLAEETARNEMFASISHDLRSPITAIKNAVELLNTYESFTKENVTPLLSLMEGRIQILEHMINDIFLLVSLDNHCISMNKKTIPLGFFLEDYFFSCEADPNYAQRKLSLEVSEDLDANVWVDEMHLTRVLENLFTNALKYSNTGDTITLGAYIKEEQVIVYVEDNGIGISKEHIDRIFDRCFIVEKARTPGHSSTGLGLSITQSIIEHFSGKIWCESTLGEGSRFSFSLPLC